MTKEELADQVFKEFNCAQTVVRVFAPELGLDKDLVTKIASGFGSGMNSGETCGAVTGAYMVLGLKAGQNTDNPATKARTKELVAKFNELFLARHKSLKCKELLGCNITAPGVREKARETGILASNCPVFIKTAVQILDQKF